MQKEQFIKIVNAIVEAKIKKIVPVLVEKKIAEVKKQLIKEIAEGTFDIPDDVELPEIGSILTEDYILPKSKPKLITTSKPEEKRITKTFTKDPKLNALLQQTAEELRNGKASPVVDDTAMQQYRQLLSEQYVQAAESGEDMETFQFNLNDIPAISSKRAIIPPVQNKMQAEIEKKIALEVGKKEIENMTGNPELSGKIMRDYRGLMKAVDEKAKSKRGA